MILESGFRTDGAQECLGNWGKLRWPQPFQLWVKLKLTSALSAWVILVNEVDPCRPQNWAVDNMLRRRLTGRKPHWDSIVTKKFLYVYKMKLQSMFEQ